MGILYVVSDILNGVVRFDGKTGVPMGTFASANGNSMNSPFMAVFGPDGNLYVSSLFSAEILRFDGTMGAYQKVFASASTSAGPTGLLFTPDGRLLVNDTYNAQVLSFDAFSGVSNGVFASGVLLFGSSGLALGPNNDVYVANPLGKTFFATRWLRAILWIRFYRRTRRGWERRIFWCSRPRRRRP